MINKASKSLTRKTPSLAFALHCTKSRDRLSFLWNWIDAQCAYIFLLCLSIQVDLSREEASNLRILGRPDRFEIIDLPGCEIQNLVREALFPFVAASYSLVSVADLWRALNLAWFVAAKKQRYKGTVRIQAHSQVRCAVRERPRTLSRKTAQTFIVSKTWSEKYCSLYLPPAILSSQLQTFEGPSTLHGLLLLKNRDTRARSGYKHAVR